ncbi:hypothetical protein OKW35_003940 [Paraburkholderia sp. MM5477-R1]
MSSFGPLIALVHLLKMTGSAGYRQIRFRRVIRIVQADADELADLADARSNARITFDDRERCRIERAQFRETFIAEPSAVDIAHHLRQIANLALRVEQARLFLAFRPITKQFHRCTSLYVQ